MSCLDGYTRDHVGDSIGCVDVDECAEDNVCTGNEKCENTAGSFVCTKCENGYGGYNGVCEYLMGSDIACDDGEWPIYSRMDDNNIMFNCGFNGEEISEKSKCRGKNGRGKKRPVF